VQLDGPPPSRQDGEDEQPPSSATAMRESRLSALASDGGPQQLASVVLLKQPPPGTTEATAAKLKSEINVPPLAAREMRTSFRDALLQRPVRGATPCPALKEIRRHEPQQLPEGSDEGWQAIRWRRARLAGTKKADKESLLHQERRARFSENKVMPVVLVIYGNWKDGVSTVWPEITRLL
jgi:hypothetical protein